MRLAFALCIALVAPAAAFAQETFSGVEFDARVSGKTLYFERAGQPFGAEQYFPDQRVIWAFEDGQCQRGIWYEDAAGDICFLYEGNPEPICWDFFKLPGGGISARAKGGHPLNDLRAVREDDAPLQCELPDLGV